MKRITKILSAFIAAAMLCTFSLSCVSAQGITVYEETSTASDVEEMGTLYIRKGGYKVIQKLFNVVNIVSENEDVAKIEKYAYIGDMYQVRAVETGVTRVTYSEYGESKIHAWNIVVEEYPETYEFSKSEVEMNVGSSYKINIIDPYDESNNNLPKGGWIYNNDAVWKSDNEDVVSVELGELYAKSEGTATITATMLNGVTLECKVTVSPYVYDSGDVDMNKKIDLYDAIMIAKFLINKVDLSEEQLSLADYNQDGKVDLYDAIEICKSLMPR